MPDTLLRPEQSAAYCVEGEEHLMLEGDISIVDHAKGAAVQLVMGRKAAMNPKNGNPINGGDSI